jgi:hypothetical protein
MDAEAVLIQIALPERVIGGRSALTVFEAP